MSEIGNSSIDINDVTPTFSLTTFLLVLSAALIGAVAALKVLPYWVPGLTESINGADAKVFWYLSRGSAFTAYALLWVSMVLGVGITNKLASLWPGLPPTIELHQYTSILGLTFVVFHGLILLGDQYMNYQLIQLLVPFSTTTYKPFLVGIGQLSIYLWMILVISFYVRKKIGGKTWRLIHFSGFLMFCFALVHGITTGSDTKTLWAQLIYWSTGLILLGLTIYRIIISRIRTAQRKQRQLGLVGQ